MKIMIGNSNPALGKAVCAFLGVEPLKVKYHSFPDQESHIDILENVRGKNIFILQSTSCPANHHIMELLFAIDALKRASAKIITCIVPYFGYARQDRKNGIRTCISAKLIADLLSYSGCHRILTVDLHSEQIQGFFNIHHDHIHAGMIFPHFIHFYDQNNHDVIISPDIGGISRARLVAGHFNKPIAVIDKRRTHHMVDFMQIIGEVKDKNCIIIDDIVDSAITLSQAALLLHRQGAKKISAYIKKLGVNGQNQTKRTKYVKKKHFS